MRVRVGVGSERGVDGLPVTRYVQTGDGGSVAFQIAGEGALDLLVLSGGAWSVDVMAEESGLLRVRQRLDRFCRNVWLDPRGVGSSDRHLDVAHGTSEAVRNAQITAVADAVGSDRFALLAFGAVGPVGIRYAAAHPERVSALILYHSFASMVRDDTCPWGWPRRFIEERLPAWTALRWGTGQDIGGAPSRKDDARFWEWVARSQRLWSSPSFAGEWNRAMFLQDVRDRLNAVRAPTLVLRRRDVFWPVEASRYLAEHIPAAKYVELEGADDFFFVGDSDALFDEIEEFLTGTRRAPEGETVVSTVLYTDIVDSTRQTAKLGHRAWTNLIAEHDQRVRHALNRHRGREIKTLGDGFLATFDSAGRAMRCATEIVADAHGIGLAVRAGIHTGEVEFRDDDVTGLAAAVGKRVCDLAAPGQILVTESVRVVTIGTSIELDDAGEHTLKGVPGTWHLHAIRT